MKYFCVNTRCWYFIANSHNTFITKYSIQGYLNNRSTLKGLIFYYRILQWTMDLSILEHLDLETLTSNSLSLPASLLIKTRYETYKTCPLVGGQQHHHCLWLDNSYPLKLWWDISRKGEVTTDTRKGRGQSSNVSLKHYCINKRLPWQNPSFGVVELEYWTLDMGL